MLAKTLLSLPMGLTISQMEMLHSKCGVQLLGKTQNVERLLVPQQYTDGQYADETDGRNPFRRKLI